jgi:FKBP-type peptidyl-prolyl cis-trans isomerase FklB
MKTNAILMFALALAGGITAQAGPMPAPKPIATAAPTPAPAPAPAAPAPTNAAPSAFATDREKNGYALGISLGANLINNWKRQGLKPEMFDLDSFNRGLKDSLSGAPLLLNPQEVRATLMAFQKTVEDERKQEGLKNKEAGDKFLADNKTKPGVVTLPSGLQYKVLTEGKGDSPKAADSVTVNYRGTFIDGTEFDSSFQRGQPATFRVAGVIHGWTEALQLMKPGAKWQLFVPPGLAYGEPGMPPGIPPSSTLVFEVELLSVTPAMTPPTPAQPVTSDIIRVPSAEELKHGAKIETIKADQLPQLTNSANAK